METRTPEWWIPVVMILLKLVVAIYGFITYPIYCLIQKPWLQYEADSLVRGISLNSDPAGPYVHRDSLKPLRLGIIPGIVTLYELFSKLSYCYKDHLCLGTREVLAEEEEKQPNGRVFQKVVFGNYQWETYEMVKFRVMTFSRGLRSFVKGSPQNVVLFAETQAEWLIAAMACFRYNFPVVTLYANLGDEALVHGINETEVNIVITSHDLLPKFKTLLAKTPKVQHIVYMEGFKKISVDGYPENVKISTFHEVEAIGSTVFLDDKPTPATKDDAAIIMYTSGSTGLPKGVIISHANLISTLTSFSDLVPVRSGDVYLAYLPLAHVLELASEFLCIMNGIPIGYSSPLTISDKSSKIKKGAQGDATILRPTFMVSVPLILDRIYKSVQDVVAEGGVLGKEIFNFAYEYKLYYLRRGFRTPIVDIG